MSRGQEEPELVTRRTDELIVGERMPYIGNHGVVGEVSNLAPVGDKFFDITWVGPSGDKLTSGRYRRDDTWVCYPRRGENELSK